MQALSERENRRLPFKALVRRRDGHSSGEAPLLSAYVPKRLDHSKKHCVEAWPLSRKPCPIRL